MSNRWSLALLAAVILFAAACGDGDGDGAAPNPDMDYDGVLDIADNCPGISNRDQLDYDNDGAGDACDVDDDNDGVADTVDNCLLNANANQSDADADGLGDVCDPDANVTISGRITYDFVPHSTVNNGLDYASTMSADVRAAEVQIIEVGTGAILASATTDNLGDYSASVPAGRNLFVQVRAESIGTGESTWNIRVVDNTQGDALYVLESSVFNSGTTDVVRNLHAASGWNGSDYAGVRAAAPFAVLDSITEARLKVLTVDPDVQFPDLVVKWSPDNRSATGDESIGEIGNTFYRRNIGGDREILLLGNEDTDTDEYDRHIVIHEWGHYFEDVISRADTIGGAHSSGDRLDPRVAYSEGFAYAFAGIVTGDPVTRDALGPDQDQGFQIDVESNSNLNPGWYSEGSVQSIIYDVVDDAADGPDVVSLGFEPLYALLSGELADSVPPITLFSFVTLLKQQNPAVAADIDAIVNAQDIDSDAIDEYATGETNDAGRGGDVLPVYSTLTIGGGVTNVCSLGGDADFGTRNKLSVRRLLKLDVAVAGSYSITAVGPAGSDPDIVLHRRGFLNVYEQTGTTETTPPIRLSPGTYVVEVYEFSNLTDLARGRTCIDVSVN